jgi:hypothetical protein
MWLIVTCTCAKPETLTPAGRAEHIGAVHVDTHTGTRKVRRSLQGATCGASTTHNICYTEPLRLHAENTEYSNLLHRNSNILLIYIYICTYNICSLSYPESHPPKMSELEENNM